MAEKNQSSSSNDTAQSSGPVESTENKDFAKLAKSKDFKRFISIQQATDKLSSEIDLKKLSTEEEKELTLQFEAWVEAGKPSATSPKTEKKEEKILRVYRRKAYGEQYLTYVVDGKPTQEGIEFVPTYRQVKDPQSGEMVEDKSMKLSETRKYTIKYTKEKAQKLVEKCKKSAPEPKFYFVVGNVVTTITNEKNFFEDFDDIMQKVNRKELV